MDRPPVHFNPSFFPQPQQLFEHLRASVTWDSRMRARKTASFGVSYDYSQISYATQPMRTDLAEICAAVFAELGFLPNNCLLNFYEDGASSMGFHSDSSQELMPGTGVAIVSLGSSRSIVFRSKADKAHQIEQLLPSGSLLYMTGEMQALWLHAIPKAPGAGPRISLTFRAIATRD